MIKNQHDMEKLITLLQSYRIGYLFHVLLGLN